MKYQQITLDGRLKDLPERHERMRLFEPVRTLPGQQTMPTEPAPATHTTVRMLTTGDGSTRRLTPSEYARRSDPARARGRGRG